MAILKILSDSLYKEQNIEMILDSYVEEIDRKKSQLTFSKDKSHKNIEYDNLVIATGTEAVIDIRFTVEP